MLLLAASLLAASHPFYRGADLSYVNEMEDCGAVYRKAGQPAHPSALMAAGGRDAGRASGKRIRIMLHIAQPENVEPWFDAATRAGVRGYDLIGISYYRKWSTRSPAQLGETIRRAHARYKADVMVVETAYPFTLENEDASPNLLGADSLLPGYPATPEGQRRYP